MLSEKEHATVKSFLKLSKSYIFLLAFTLTVGGLHIYLLLNRFIPTYLTPIAKYEAARAYVKNGMEKIVFSSLFWIFILLGVLLGSFIMHLKLKKILKKVTNSL